MPIEEKDTNIPKKLCDLGLAISLSQGRRMVSLLPEKRLQKMMEEAEQKRKVDK